MRQHNRCGIARQHRQGPGPPVRRIGKAVEHRTACRKKNQEQQKEKGELQIRMAAALFFSGTAVPPFRPSPWIRVQEQQKDTDQPESPEPHAGPVFQGLIRPEADKGLRQLCIIGQGIQDALCRSFRCAGILQKPEQDRQQETGSHRRPERCAPQEPDRQPEDPDQSCPDCGHLPGSG